MRLIIQQDNTSALLIGEDDRMQMARDITLTAKWLDDNKPQLHDPHMEATALALVEKLHTISYALSADRSGELYVDSEVGEDDIERLRRLAGQCGCAEVQT